MNSVMEARNGCNTMASSLSRYLHHDGKIDSARGRGRVVRLHDVLLTKNAGLVLDDEAGSLSPLARTAPFRTKTFAWFERHFRAWLYRNMKRYAAEIVSPFGTLRPMVKRCCRPRQNLFEFMFTQIALCALWRLLENSPCCRARAAHPAGLRFATLWEKWMKLSPASRRDVRHLPHRGADPIEKGPAARDQGLEARATPSRREISLEATDIMIPTLWPLCFWHRVWTAGPLPSGAGDL